MPKDTLDPVAPTFKRCRVCFGPVYPPQRDLPYYCASHRPAITPRTMPRRIARAASASALPLIQLPDLGIAGDPWGL